MTKIYNRSGNVLYECESDKLEECVVEALNSDTDLSYANLRGADLRGVNLSGAVLIGVDLSYAELSGVNLRGVNLRGADLSYAQLRGVNLIDSDLSGAYLGYSDLATANIYNANLNEANLIYANLRGVNLRGANLNGSDIVNAELYGAKLSGAKNIPYIPLNCPSDGEFTAWKKVGDMLVRLLIPADARRSSSTSLKCRCDKAMVVRITDLDETEEYENAVNMTPIPLTYRVGEMAYPDSYDEDRWNECSHGIHFFINKKDAINY